MPPGPGATAGALVLFSKYLSQAPRIFRFSWEILVYAAIIIFVIKRTYTLRKKKEAVKIFSAQVEECHDFTQTECLHKSEACRSPPEEVSPLKLRPLCLSALHTNINRFTSSLGDFQKRIKK